jgi:L-threonylcarbamoyladenylate synthase
MISEDDIILIAGNPQPQNIMCSDKTLAEEAKPKAPGQHALHYSPRTPLFLFKDKIMLIQECEALTQAGFKCAALLIGKGKQPNCNVVQLSNKPVEVAERLYSALHELDAMKVDRLLVELPDNTPKWAAVLDRLNRAGHRG